MIWYTYQVYIITWQLIKLRLIHVIYNMHVMLISKSNAILYAAEKQELLTLLSSEDDFESSH